jgi:Leucine-rich repeat (LRR) protein
MLKKQLFFFMIILINSCSDNPVDTLVEYKFTFIPDSNFEQLLIDQGIDSDGILNGMVLDNDIAGVIYLPLSNSNISDLSGLENFVNLKKLDCFNNQLISLDVSQNKALKELNCRNNQLTSLDVSHNTRLTSLECAENRLTSLDVNQNTDLATLGCSMNQISSLDVSLNIALTLLYCSENLLTNLDVSKNIK